MSSASVEVGDELDRLVTRLIREANPAVADRLESEVRDLLDIAVASWPVGPDRRGHVHSRSLFRTELVVTPDAIEARLINDAPYLFHIRTVQNNLDGKSPFVKLIRTPARKRAKQLAIDIGDDLVRLGGR